MSKRVTRCLALVTALLMIFSSVALAAPAMGVYLGGSVMKYYTFSEFVGNATTVPEEITKAGLANVAAVDQTGKILVAGEAINGGTFREVVPTDLQGTYQKSDGTTYEPNPQEPTELKVESVTAVSGTQVTVVLSNVPTELPAPSAFQVSDSNGNVYAVVNIAPSQTVGEYILTLGTAVTGKGTLTVKCGNSEASKEFDTTTQGLTLDIAIDDEDATLIADGADNALITVTVKRDGQIATDFQGNVKFISVKGAPFAKELVAFDQGKASVQLTSLSSATAIQDTIMAVIADAEDKTFVGTSTSMNVMYVPEAAGGDVAEKVFITYAESDRASDVFVRFNKKFDFGALYKDWKANGVITVTRYGDTEPVPVDDIVKIDDTTVKLVLLEDHALIDNSAVTVQAVSSGVTGSLIDSSFTFNLVDAKAPEAVGVKTPDYRTIEAIFTEPVFSTEATKATNWVLNGHQLLTADVKFIEVGRDVVDDGVIEQDDIKAYVPDAEKPVDNRSYVTIQLNSTGAGYLKPAGQENLLQAYNIIDYAGLTDETGQNKATTQEFTFVTPAPPSAPSAEVVMESPEQFRVVFSTDVEPLNASNFKFEYQNGVDNNGNPKWATVELEDTVSNAAYAVVTPLSAREYLIELEEDWTRKLDTAATGINYYTPKHNVVRITAFKGIQNLAGVEMTEDDVNTVTMTLDATSPTISRAEQVYDASGNPLQEFLVRMSEPVQMFTDVQANDTKPLTPSQKQGTAVPTPTFQFVNADESKTIDGVLGGPIDDGDTEFTVKPEEGKELDPGEWTIYIRSISDDVGNTSPTTSGRLTVAGAVAKGEPEIIWADAHDVVAASVYKDVVHVQFGTIMSNDALKTNVYTINGKALGTEAMVTSEEVEYEPGIKGTLVTITLPANFLDKDEPNMLNVSKALADAEGNVIKAPTEVQLTYDPYGLMPTGHRA